MTDDHHARPGHHDGRRCSSWWLQHEMASSSSFSGIYWPDCVAVIRIRRSSLLVCYSSATRTCRWRYALLAAASPCRPPRGCSPGRSVYRRCRARRFVMLIVNITVDADPRRPATRPPRRYRAIPHSLCYYIGVHDSTVFTARYLINCIPRSSVFIIKIITTITWN